MLVRIGYTLLPPGYIERHGGKPQKVLPPPPPPPSAPPPSAPATTGQGVGSGDAAKESSGVANKSTAPITSVPAGGGGSGSGGGSSSSSSDGKGASDRANRWLLSTGEASDDVASMRVSERLLH